MENFSNTSGNLWHYCGNALNATITGAAPFKSKAKITVRASYAGNTKDVETALPLKYFSNF